MRVLRTIREVREDRADASSVALVPTMGSFHEGHLELMRRARALAERVYVSLFVNPTQFGEGEDFSAYPRDERRDLALAESAGMDAVFAPSVEEMYRGRSVSVHVGGVSDKWEGEHRPGHFDGVATVVAKLFNVFSPDTAVFGLKDLQQCAVVRALALGLDIPVRLEFVETVRDENGLALSSRNAYFTDAQRRDASALYRVLCACASGSLSIAEGREELEAKGFSVEYLACVDPETMLECVGEGTGQRMICAARFHGVRLIDNVAVKGG